MAFTGGIKREEKTSHQQPDDSKFTQTSEISGLLAKFREASTQKGLVDEIVDKKALTAKRKSKIYDVLQMSLEGFSDDEIEALTEALYDGLKEELK